MEMSLNAMVLFLIEFNIIAESFDHKKSSRRGGRRVASHFEWVVGQPQCAVQFALSIFGGCRRNSMIIKSIRSHCAALQFSSSSLVAGCCLEDRKELPAIQWLKLGAATAGVDE